MIANKRSLLMQEHEATGLKVFLASMKNRHIQHLIYLARDPSLIDLMGWNPFFELEEDEKFIQALANFALPYSRQSQPVVFGVYLSPEDLPIGYAVLKGINMDLSTAEIGVSILDRKYRSGGYGKLALNCTIAYAFQERHLQTIGAAIVLSNKRSINMCKKLGFSMREILGNSWTMPNGDIVDMAWLEVTEKTWISLK